MKDNIFIKLKYYLMMKRMSSYGLMAELVYAAGSNPVTERYLSSNLSETITQLS